MSLFEKVVVVLALNSQGFDVKMKHVDAGLCAAFQRLSGMIYSAIRVLKAVWIRACAMALSNTRNWSV